MDDKNLGLPSGMCLKSHARELAKRNAASMNDAEQQSQAVRGGRHGKWPESKTKITPK